MSNLLFTLIIVGLMLFPSSIQARITPEDIVNSKKEAFNQKVANYSPASKQKLETISQKIVELNRTKTTVLEKLMLKQGLILDEYVRRTGQDESSAVEKARYWITFAHEAVAYQAAKIYVFNLTSESNLRSDMLSRVNIFQNELAYARSQVIKSQKILEEVIADE